mgnify:CR=1 FL=1
MLEALPKSVSELPDWNYDGSSTNQAPGHDSEVLIKPAAMFRDPFRGGDNIMVICDTYRPDGNPVADLPVNGGISGNNNRAAAMKVFGNPKVIVKKKRRKKENKQERKRRKKNGKKRRKKNEKKNNKKKKE